MKSTDIRLSISILFILSGGLTLCKGDSSMSTDGSEITTDPSETTLTPEPSSQVPLFTSDFPTTVEPLESPDSITFNSSTTNSILVSWSGGSGHEGFNIVWEPVTDDDESGSDTTLGHTREYDITDLTPGVFYNISVSSYKGEETSQSVSDVEGTNPLAPDSADVLSFTHNSIEFEWTHPEESIFTKVEIECYPSGDCFVGDVNGDSITVDGLDGNKNYLFQIYTVSSRDNLSKKSEPKDLPQWTLSAPVTSLSATSEDPNSMNVSWKYPEDNNEEDDGIHCYRLRVIDESSDSTPCVEEVLFTRNGSMDTDCPTSNNCGDPEHITFTRDVTYEVNELQPCGTYSVHVDVFNVVGPSNEEVQEETVQIGAPEGPVENILFEKIETTSMTLLWTQPPGLCPIVAYRVWYKLEEDDELQPVNATIPIDVPRVEIVDLEPCGNYSIEIVAFTSEEDEHSSNILVYNTTAIADPASPVENVVFTEIGTDNMKVTWDRPKDPRLCPIIGYRIHYELVNGDNDGEVVNITDTEYYYMKDLEACGNYSVTISAFTVEDGHAGESTVTEQETTETADPASPVENVDFTEIGTDNMKVTWDRPKDPSLCPIIGYRIHYELINGDDDGEVVNITDTEYLMEDLEACGNYSVTISAFTVEDGNAGESTVTEHETTETADPASPVENVAFTEIGTDYMKVTWDRPKDPSLCPIIGYRIHYELVNGDDDGEVVNITDTEYLMEDLEACGIYSVTISAFTVEDGNAGESTVTEQETTETADPASPVENVAFTEIGTDYMKVTWDRPKDPSLCPIIGYRIHYELINGDDDGEVVNITDTEYLMEDLEACGNYSVTISAFTVEDGNAGESTVTEHETTETADPASPVENVAFTEIGTDYMKVTWDRPKDPSLCPIIGYRIHYELVNGDDDGEVVNITDTEYLMEDLEACGIYSVTISAFTVEDGNAGESTVTEQETTETADPGSPVENVNFTEIGTDYMKVTWDRPKDPSLCPIIGYRIHYELVNGDDDGEVVNITDTEYLMEDLEACGIYSVTISAFTVEDGNAGESTVTEHETTETADPASPVENVAFTEIGTDYMKVTWDRPKDPSLCPIIGYRIHYELVNGDDDGEVVNITDTEYLMEDLEACGNYSVTISAFTVEDGNAGDSTVTEHETTETADPASPVENVAFTEIGTDYMKVTWDRPKDPSLCPIIGYRIHYELINGDDDGEVVNITDTEYLMEDLEACGNYSVTISAFTVEDGNAGESTVTEHETTETADPASPVENVAFTEIGTDYMKVTWDRPKDPSLCPIIGYRIHYELVNGDDDGEVVNITDTEYLMEDLEACGIYSVTISAFTVEDGNAGDSTVTEHETTETADPASPVENVDFTEIGTDNMKVTWDCPDDPRLCPIIGYRLHYVLVNGDDDGKVVNVTDPNYHMEKLEACGDYSLTISAFTRVDGTAGNSTVTEQETTETADPASPVENVNFTEIGTDNMKVTWDRPDDPRLCPIIGYRLHYVLVNGDDDGKVVNVTDPNYHMEKLEACGDYSLTISAFTRVDGTAGNSTVTGQETTDTADAGPVQNFTLMGISSTSVELSWGTPIEPKLCDIKGYQIVYLYKDCNELNNVITENWNDTDYDNDTIYVNITGLQPYWEYSFTVRATTILEEINGNASTINVTTEEAEPGEPTDFKVEEAGSHYLEVTWDEPHACKINGVIHRYDLEYTCTEWDRDDVTAEDSESISDDERFFNLTLMPFQDCELFLSASTSAGPGDQASTEGQTKISTPGKIDIGAVNITSLQDGFEIYWEEPPFRNGPIVNYSIEYSLAADFKKQADQNGTESGVVFPLSPNITMVTLSGLLPHAKYGIIIKAATKSGWGEPSETITEETSIAPAMPVKDVNVEPYKETALVTWQEPDMKTGPTTYTVTVFDSVDHSFDREVTVEGFSNTSGLVAGLDPNWWYSHIEVVASTVEGQSNVTKGAGFLTQPDKPYAPVSFYPEYADEEDRRICTKLSITWHCHTGRDKRANITEYLVIPIRQGDEENHLNFPVEDLEQESYNEIIDVSPESNYTFKIQAIAGDLGDILKWEEGIHTRSCPPDIPQGEVDVDESTLVTWYDSDTSDISTKRQFKVTVDEGFLGDNSNGRINDAGIIVADADAIEGQDVRAELFEDTKEFYQKYNRDWFDVQNEDKFPAYIATRIVELHKARVKRTEDPSQPVQIGRDENCEDFSENDLCNGYVRPGRKYRVKAFTCSDGGCTVSAYSVVIETSPDPTNMIIIGTVVPLVLIVMVVAGFFIYRSRRNLPGKSKSHMRQGSSPGNDNEALDLTELKPSPITIDKFPHHVGMLHKDSDLGFSEEYKNLKDMSPQNPWKAALIENNRSKNRWVNILPFDHSRVKLLPVDDEEGSDYINANYMPGYRSKREFIAAQGPLPGTKDDFWRMIWEQNVPIVVMLTNCVERGRPKCDQYWPNDQEPVYYGDLQVQKTSESTLDSYTIRIMNVNLGETVRTIKQFHYTMWPDFGCPDTPESLLKFVDIVRSHIRPTDTGPTLAHCSAGVGRTGTFIVVDRLMQHIQDHNTIDVFGIIHEMRNYRCNMVQTEDQYIYIHDCLVTAITGSSPNQQDRGTDSEYDEKEDEESSEDEEEDDDDDDEEEETQVEDDAV